MSETMAETILTRRSSAESRSLERAMASMSYTVDELNGTTTRDESTTELPAAIEGPYVPRSIPGGVVIEAQAYTRTNDEQALRYAGSTPTHIVGLCSETKVRNALAEYTTAEADRALDWGKQLEAEHMDNANAAIAAAESETAELATAGGLQ